MLLIALGLPDLTLGLDAVAGHRLGGSYILARLMEKGPGWTVVYQYSVSGLCLPTGKSGGLWHVPSGIREDYGLNFLPWIDSFAAALLLGAFPPS